MLVTRADGLVVNPASALVPAGPAPADARPRHGIARTVDDSFRHVVGGGLIVLLLLGSLVGWLLCVSRPAVSHFERGLVALQTQRTAMLDEETAIRGYLITGQDRYLQPYRRAATVMPAADRTLLSITGDTDLTNAVIELRVAQQQWLDNWAAPVAAGQRTFSAGSDTAKIAFLDAGKALFDSYRAAHARAVGLATGRLGTLRTEQINVLVGVTATAGIIGALTLVIAIRLRTRLQRRILAPVASLLTGLQAVREGRLDGELSSAGPKELAQVIDGFNEMTASLRAAREDARRGEQRISDKAHQLRAVLSMVREIGGSLNSGYVLAAITDGVLSISGAERATVWLTDDQNGGPLDRAWDSDPLQHLNAGSDLVNHSHVSTAAKFGRTTLGHAGDGTANRIAVPLIVGARVIGVLELVLFTDRPMSDEQVEVVETLSIHAATAIEATRLHEGTARASEHDALTGLANRRRLEADLAEECDRSLRYGNPLAFVMLDLDHFKRLNDTHGHQQGDEALQACAQEITAALRASDTAYRYGGEELAIIARETTLDGGLQLAERLRAAIESRYPGAGGALRVTASFGVAAMPEHAASPRALIAAADAALYAAKTAGRNRVLPAGTADTTALLVEPLVPSLG